MADGNGFPGPKSSDELKDRIKKAVEEADLAFWEKIALAFPEAKGGDFPPEDHFAWNRARDEAVYTWLLYNHPAGGLVRRMRSDE